VWLEGIGKLKTSNDLLGESNSKLSGLYHIVSDNYTTACPLLQLYKIKREVKMTSIIHNAKVIRTSKDREIGEDVKEP
jgi:hypothetical protein